MRQKEVALKWILLVLLLLVAPIALADPAIVTLQGKLTDNSDNPITTASLRINITNEAGSVIWGAHMFNNTLDSNGVFNIPLGTTQSLDLSLGGVYQLVLEVDDGATAFSTPDVIFGDDSPSTDVIKFVHGQNDTLTSTKIATNAIGAAQIAADAIGAEEAGFLTDSTGFAGGDIGHIKNNVSNILNKTVGTTNIGTISGDIDGSLAEKVQYVWDNRASFGAAAVSNRPGQSAGLSFAGAKGFNSSATVISTALNFTGWEINRFSNLTINSNGNLRIGGTNGTGFNGTMIIIVEDTLTVAGNISVAGAGYPAGYSSNGTYSISTAIPGALFWGAGGGVANGGDTSGGGASGPGGTTLNSNGGIFAVYNSNITKILMSNPFYLLDSGFRGAGGGNISGAPNQKSNGGGNLYIEAKTIIINTTGIVSASGEGGKGTGGANYHGGGGGGGGVLWIKAQSLTNNGIITAGGGGGGGGRADGGTPGSGGQDGKAGTAGVGAAFNGAGGAGGGNFGGGGGGGGAGSTDVGAAGAGGNGWGIAGSAGVAGQGSGGGGGGGVMANGGDGGDGTVDGGGGGAGGYVLIELYG